MLAVIQKTFFVRYCFTVFVFLFFGFFGFSFAESEPSDHSNEATEVGEQRIVERFWMLLTNSPRRGTSFDRVYGFYVDSGRLEMLLQRCLKQTEERPEDAKTWSLLGLVLSRSGNDRQAIEAWKQATLLAPSDLLTATYLGEALIADGKIKQAIEAMERTVGEFEKNVQGSNTISNIQTKDLLGLLQLLGRGYERFNDRQNADRIWQRIETRFPDDKEILQQIAETLENEDKLAEALKRYQKLVELSKNDDLERTRYQLAATEIKIKQNRTQEAIENLDQLLDGLSGESWIAETIRERIERLFSRNADYEGLAAYYSERIETHPPELETVRRYAIVLFRLSRRDEAKAVLLQALDKAPENIPIRLALIDLFVAEKDFESVDKQYAEIDRIQANHPDYLTQWGLAVLENKNRDDQERKSKATKIWNRLIAAKPNDPATVIMVAELTNSAGIYDEAERLYQKAVELRPNDPGFKEYLGYFYHQRQEKTKAVATLRRMVEGNLATAANLERLAGIFKSLGYADDASKVFQEAVDLAPDDLNIRLQYIDLLLENGKWEQVEKELDCAKKFVGDINSEGRRFIETEIKFFRTTDRIAEKATEKQRSLNRIENPTAFDYWQLAMYQANLDRMHEAENAIGQALELEPNSTPLLQATTKIYARAGNLHRSVSIVEKLVETDPARRIEYLKQLVDLYRSLGESKKSLETAKLVMASGAGNPINLRFYASRLWEAGRQKESIEILRRAVRLDSNDTASLHALADALLELGQRNEGIELLWRIFEKTDNIQGKLGLVSRLSELYRQSGDFNRLTERLKQLSPDARSKQEPAYCIAQAYVSANRLDDARRTLELLLNDFNKKDSEDTTLLSQLSRVAELQGDMPAAIKYQEAVCKQIVNVDESNRLLSLYRLSGNTEKTLDHLLRTVVAKGDLADSLILLDNLLASEDYASACQVVDRLKASNPTNWELLYRRLTLEFWRNNIDEAEKIAESFLALKIERDEPSVFKRGENTSLSPIRRDLHSSENWIFQSSQQPFQASNLFFSTDTAILQRWAVSATILIKTLFRDRLEYVEGSAAYQSVQPSKGASISNKTTTALPQFVPENFGEAQFAVRAWLFRIALQRDTDESLKQHPGTNERETVMPTENTVLPSVCTGQTIAALRRQLTANGNGSDRLTERLRLEFFFDQLQRTAKNNPNKFEKANYAKLFFKDLVENSTIRQEENEDFQYDSISFRFRTKIACELAFRGELDWFCTAYDSLLKELYADFLFEHYDENLFRQQQERFDLLVRDSTIRELFDDRQIASAKASLFDSVRKAEKAGNPFQTDDPRTKKEKLDFLIRCWTAIDNRSLENRPDGFRDVFLIAEQYPLFVSILRQQNEEKEIAIIESIYEKLARRFPAVLGLWTDACLSKILTDKSSEESQSLTNLVRLARMKFAATKNPVRNSLSIRYHRSWLSNNSFGDLGRISPVLDFVQWKERQNNFSDPIDFAKFQGFVEKIQQFVLSDEFRVRSRQSGAIFSAIGNLSDQAVLDAAVAKYLESKLGPLYYSLQFNSDRFSDDVSFSILGGVVVRTKNFRSATAASEKRKRTVNRQQLNAIASAVDEIFRLSEYYFQLSNDIETKTATDKHDPNSVLIPYRRAFEENLDDSTPTQTPTVRIPVGQAFQSRNVVLTHLTSSEQTLFFANSFLTAADAFLRFAEPSFELSEGETGPLSNLVRQIKTFDLFLDSRAKLGTETDRKHVLAYRTISTMFQGSHIPVESGIRMHDIRSYLEIQKNQFDRERPKPSVRLLIILAAANYRLDQFGQAVDYLDAIDLKTQDDNRLREKWILNMYNRSFLLGSIPKSRVEKAIRFFESIPDLRQTELLALQRSQDRIGQKEQAQKSRDKLLESADDLTIQIQVLRQLAQETAEKDSIVFEFAKKVFMEPNVQKAMSEDDGISWKAREASLDLLAKSGKLESLIKEFETKYVENSESIETMISLADLYFRAGRMEQTENIIKQIDELISLGRSSDLRLFRAYAYRGSMKNKVAQWRYETEAKLVAEKLVDPDLEPAKLLRGVQHYADLAERYGLSRIFVERLEKIEPERLAASFGEMVYYLERWLEKRTTKDSANQLLKYIWNLENSDDKTKRRLRSQIVEKISHRTRQEVFYPMFRDVVFDFIRNLSEETLQNVDGNPFAVRTWSVEQGFGTVTTLLDLADRHGMMSELNQEALRLTQSDDIQQDRIKKTAASLLLATTEARRDNAQAAVEIMQSLPIESDEFRHGDLLIAQEFSKLHDPQADKIAAVLYRRFLKSPTTDRQTKNKIEKMLNQIENH